MAFRRTRGRFKRAKREYMWTCTTSFGGTIPATGSTTALVDATDWSGISTTQALSRGAVLQRIVGWWMCTANAALSEDGPWVSNCARMMIWKNTTEGFLAASAAPLNLANAVSYVTEDVLYMDGIVISNSQSTDGQTQAASFPGVRFDIRTKRKLTSDDDIIMSLDLDLPGTQANTLFGVWRSLIQLP